jgi:hypothetical protein
MYSISRNLLYTKQNKTITTIKQEKKFISRLIAMVEEEEEEEGKNDDFLSSFVYIELSL